MTDNTPVEESPDQIAAHPTQLDPAEESAVEVSEFHARRREEQVEAMLARQTVSDVQLAANRANAQLSTGPSSPAGRAISARNNFRHGLTQVEGDLVLIETESADEYSHALSEFQAEWQPETATERDLVERLASRQWLRRRALRLQKYYISPADGQILDHEQFTLYRRYEVQHERAYSKALSDLIRLRSLRLRERNGFESQTRKNEEHKYKIQAQQDREILRKIVIRTAEARATLLESKLKPVPPPETPQQPTFLIEMRD